MLPTPKAKAKAEAKATAPSSCSAWAPPCRSCLSHVECRTPRRRSASGVQQQQQQQHTNRNSNDNSIRSNLSSRPEGQEGAEKVDKNQLPCSTIAGRPCGRCCD